MNDAEYQVLEEQWTPLLIKFAGWQVPGMDHEDIMQELRIILLRSQERYDAGKHTKFITFLYTALLNRMLKLLRDSGTGSEPRQKWIPPYQVFPMCTGDHRGGRCDSSYCTSAAFEYAHETGALSDLDLVNLFGDVSTDAKWLIGLIARESVTTANQDKDPRWSKSTAIKVMGRKRFKQGIEELKVVLRGGLS